MPEDGNAKKSGEGCYPDTPISQRLGSRWGAASKSPITQCRAADEKAAGGCRTEQAP